MLNIVKSLKINKLPYLTLIKRGIYYFLNFIFSGNLKNLVKFLSGIKKIHLGLFLLTFLMFFIYLIKEGYLYNILNKLENVRI